MNTLENIKKFITKLAIGTIAILIAFILIIIGFICLHSYYQNNKVDKIAKTAKKHTSKVIAYDFQGSNGNDLVKLKDGVKFKKNNLSIGDSNFESKVPFNSSKVQMNKEITYLKKPNKNSAHTYYYITKIE
jgi:uncharacterized protein with FMN-binding domain